MKIDWSLGAQIAQVVATLLMAASVWVSFWIGRRTLTELRSDRQLRIRPRLLFNRGGQLIHCELVDSDGIPGIAYDFATKLVGERPPGANHLRVKGDAFWGGLVNHGAGSALNVAVTIIAKSVVRAGERFLVDGVKLESFPYRPRLNHIPGMPSHIPPNETCRFYRLPTPIVCDFKGHISQMDCVALLQCEDLNGTSYETQQELTIFVRRGSDSPSVIMTFGEEIVASESGGRGDLKPLLPGLFS